MELVPGLILSAGRSSRMGRSKAFLPCSPAPGDTFLRRIIESMRAGGLEDVLVVGRPDDAQLIEAIEQPTTAARFIANPDHERGQLTSIVAGVNAVDHPGVRGVLIMPVDMPLVQPSTFRAVLRMFSLHPSSIVRAVCGGRHGHPVIFDRGSFGALRHADVAVGAKAVLADHRHRILDLETDDAGVLKDVDSREDYSALFGRTLDTSVQS
jgi:CTP:molybdopterin cytidylyltransferase MocA